MRRGIPERLLSAPASSYRVSNVRYKPCQKLVIGLVSNVGGNPVGMRVFPRKHLADRLVKARSEHPDHTFLLPDADAVAWVFPAERKLKLAVVADPDALAELLSAHRGAVLRRLDLVHFVPEHSYTARVIAEQPDGSRHCEYLKIYYNDAGARAARIAAQLSVQSRRESISLPRSIAYFPEHRMMLQSALPRDPHAKLSLHRAAVALAEFHGLRALTAPKMVNASEQKIDTAIALVEAVFPGQTHAMARIGRLVQERLAATVAAPDCLLHGDAHLGNLFPLTDGKVGVIDLDGVTIGPPEHDIASFFAFKLWITLREQSPGNSLLDQYPAFIETYNAAAENPISIERAWATLAEKLLTERVCRGISRGKLASEAELEDFLALAADCLRRVKRIDV